MAFGLQCTQFAKSFSTGERHIGITYDHLMRKIGQPLKGFTGHHHGMTRAELRHLHDTIGAIANGSPHLISLMTNHHYRRDGRDLDHGAENVIEHGFAPDEVQHFGEFRFHARTFASSKNDRAGGNRCRCIGRLSRIHCKKREYSIENVETSSVFSIQHSQFLMLS